MTREKLSDWIHKTKNREILISFSSPKTPVQVEKENSIRKFNLKPFLKRRLLKCLNPESYKGRLYLLTTKAKKLLNVSTFQKRDKKDYELIGWILASPKQRYVILKTLSQNSTKRTSEEIRFKSKNQNPCLSRISTKNILKELLNKGLVESEMGEDRKRYYWVSEDGESLSIDLLQRLEKKVL